MGLMMARRRIEEAKKRKADLKAQAQKKRHAENKAKHGPKPVVAPEAPSVDAKGTK